MVPGRGSWSRMNLRLPNAEGRKNGGNCCFKMRSPNAILVVARNKEELGDKINQHGFLLKM